ncbi:MAG: integrase, partial [Methylocystis sp.]
MHVGDLAQLARFYSGAVAGIRSAIDTNARAKPSRKEKDEDAPDSGAPSEGGLLLTINGKTGWREVEIGRGSHPDTCPVVLLETWMRLGRVNHRPLFRRIARKNGSVSSERLTDKHVA